MSAGDDPLARQGHGPRGAARQSRRRGDDRRAFQRPSAPLWRGSLRRPRALRSRRATARPRSDRQGHRQGHAAVLHLPRLSGIERRSRRHARNRASARRWPARSPCAARPKISTCDTAPLTRSPSRRAACSQRILGKSETMVNTVHRQGIKRLAPALSRRSQAPDGVIEAASVKGAASFAFGTQWHPEYKAAHNAGFGEAVRRLRRCGAPLSCRQARRSGAPGRQGLMLHPAHRPSRHSGRMHTFSSWPGLTRPSSDDFARRNTSRC